MAELAVSGGRFLKALEKDLAEETPLGPRLSSSLMDSRGLCRLCSGLSGLWNDLFETGRELLSLYWA